MFKDWKECSQEPIHLPLDPAGFYYLQAQAWHLKGYLGGTHSYCAFNHNQQWMVIELTDIETLEVQKADVLYHGTDTKLHAPFISSRPYNARWFGHKPYIVDSCTNNTSYEQIVEVTKNYPLKEFNLLKQNCNTFTSYLIASLNLDLERPFRSVGFRNKQWWQKNHGIKI